MIWPGTDLLEERASSNAARPGDSDYGQGGPLTQAQKDARKRQKRGGKGTKEGGQFISQGASGSDVEAVQRGVGAEVTGTYTTGTAASVRAFQKKHGLKVDGVVGRQTARALAGDYEGARKTDPGALRGSERNLIKRHRKKKAGTGKKRGTSARGGFLVEAVLLERQLIEEVLQERAVQVTWDEALHPRDQRGRFRKKLGALNKGQAIQLPDGTRISKDRDGTYRVVRSGRIHSGFKTRDAAVQDALDRSARATNSEQAIGGRRRHRDFNEYLEGATVGRGEWQETDTLENLQARLERARADVADALTAQPGSYEARRLASTQAVVRHLEHRLRVATRSGGVQAPASPGPIRVGTIEGARVAVLDLRVGQRQTINGRDVHRRAANEVMIDGIGPVSAAQAAIALGGPSAAQAGPGMSPAQLAELPAAEIDDRIQRLEGYLRTGRVIAPGGERDLEPAQRTQMKANIAALRTERLRRVAADPTSARSPGVDPVAAAAPAEPSPAGGIDYTPEQLTQLERALATATPGTSIHAAVQTQVDAARAHLARQPAPAPPAEIEWPDAVIMGRRTPGLKLRAYGRPSTWEGGYPRMYVASNYTAWMATRTGNTQVRVGLTFERVDPGSGGRLPSAGVIMIHGVPYVMRTQGVAYNRPAQLSAITSSSFRNNQRGATDLSRADYAEGQELSRRRHVIGEETMHPATARYFEGVEAERQARIAANRPGATPTPESPRRPGSTGVPGHGAITDPNTRQVADRIVAGAEEFRRAFSTQIEAVSTQELGGRKFLYVRGQDGRSWSVNVEEVRNGVFTNSTVQVRTQGGDVHGAPAFGTFLQQTLGGPASQVTGGLIPATQQHPSLPAGNPARHGPSRQGPSPAIPSPEVATGPGTAPRVSGVRHATERSELNRAEKVQAIVDRLHGFSHGGYTTKITRASTSDFSGVVLDADGRQVGNFSRSIESDTQIYHSIFQISQPARASGYGTRLVNEMFDSYKAQGFKRVKVSAGIDVGGYQWAKMGFEHTGGPAAVKSHARAYMSNVRRAVSEGRIPQALADEFERQVDEGMITSMSQIAAWGRRTTWEITVGTGDQAVTHKMWLGKVLLLGSGWSGVKKLT
jgi:hypothetical protein